MPRIKHLSGARWPIIKSRAPLKIMRVCRLLFKKDKKRERGRNLSNEITNVWYLCITRGLISRIVPVGDRVSHGITIDQPSPRVERGRKELVGRLCHSAFRVIFLDIDAREGQEREREKKGSRKVDPNKSINRPSFFPTRVIIIGLSVLPSTIVSLVPLLSLSLSFCESAKGAVRVQKCWFCKEIYEIALN